MTKKEFEEKLEQHFEDFELGDTIQVADDYIYFEFQMNMGDRKMRIPFFFDYFQRALKLYGTDPEQRNFYIAANMSAIKTEILKNLLDLKEKNENV